MNKWLTVLTSNGFLGESKSIMIDQPTLADQVIKSSCIAYHN